MDRLVIPADAPEFFVRAVERAKEVGRPVIIDFWAEWCAACLRLKHETLENSHVAESLRSLEMVYVDLDKYPALGDAYGVAAIPDVIFAKPDGRIVDRLQQFESPQMFVLRLQRLFGKPQSESK